MEAKDLVTDQYFTIDAESDSSPGTGYITLPRDETRPDKVLGKLIYLYKGIQTQHVRALKLNDKVTIVKLYR
jgi:hypothetical protein